MAKDDPSDLMKNPEVVDEINRHKWIESEKAGYDIGFEKAAEDWIEQYSQEWMDANQRKTKNGRKVPKTRKRERER